MTNDKNVLGTELEMCCSDPMTGFMRNGYCLTPEGDRGVHVACARVTQEFLEFSAARGNDLMTPRPEYDFPGLKDGDQWCLCAGRWWEAFEAGVAPPLVLEATHEKMLENAPLEVLKKYELKQETAAPAQTLAGAYQFSFKAIDGADMPLADFKGQVLLIVNTASQCGFTDQYEGLQQLHDTYKDQGLTVIGVPCNDFGRQEPGDEQAIKDFIKDTYQVTFPITEKYSVKGADAHPFFAWAKDQGKGGLLFSSPRWNFHKFLIDRNGQVYKSYGSQVSPTSKKIRQDIEKLLSEQS